MASERFVLHMARTDAEVMAKARQANFQALPGGTASLRANIGGDQIQRESTSLDPIEQKLYESNLASTGDLKRDPITRVGWQKLSVPCRPALCGIPNDAAGTAIATRNPVRVARTFGRLHNVFVQAGFGGRRDAIARGSTVSDALLDLKARTIR